MPFRALFEHVVGISSLHTLTIQIHLFKLMLSVFPQPFCFRVSQRMKPIFWLSPGSFFLKRALEVPFCYGFCSLYAAFSRLIYKVQQILLSQGFVFLLP